jgi:hypothetical protein
MYMSLVAGSSIFSGNKKIYYFISIILIALGIGFLISAYLSYYTTDVFNLMIIIGIIIIILAIISMICTYKSSKK